MGVKIDYLDKTHYNYGERTEEPVNEIDKMAANIRAIDAEYGYDACPQCGDDFLGVNMTRGGNLAFIHNEGHSRCEHETDVDHVYLQTDGIELTAEQSERAKDALERAENDEATCATDLLDEWKTAPSNPVLRRLSNTNDNGYTGTVYGWISTEDICGTDGDGEFLGNRIEITLRRMINGRYRPEHTRNNQMPHYKEICGDLYVGQDGNHRSVACKYVGVDEIYAQISEYDVDEDAYNRWKAQRDGEMITTFRSAEYRDLPRGNLLSKTGLGTELIAAIGGNKPRTRPPERVSHSSKPIDCDVCGDAAHYILDHIVEAPRQIFGRKLPWSSFNVETMCYDCWRKSDLSDEYYAPEDPSKLYEQDMPPPGEHGS